MLMLELSLRPLKEAWLFCPVALDHERGKATCSKAKPCTDAVKTKTTTKSLVQNQRCETMKVPGRSNQKIDPWKCYNKN